MPKMLTPPIKASIISFLIAAPAFGAKIVVTDRYEIDTAEKIAAVQASDGLEIQEGAVVDYSAEDDLVLTDSTPVTGSGSFVHASGGKLLLLGDNSAFAGAWYITNAAVVVSNRYGLGSSATKGAFFKADDAHRHTTLHFGGAGLTNDVPLTLDGCFSLKDSLVDELIFNGLVSRGPNATYISTGNTHFRGGFKGIGNSPCFEPSGANANETTSTWIYFESQIAEDGYLQLHGSNSAVQHFVISNGNESAKNRIGLLECLRGYLHCGSKNVFGSVPGKIRLGGPYTTKEWKTAVFDLNGFDQTATTLFLSSGGNPYAKEEDGEKYVTEVTSAEPATLTLTAADTTTATKFTGAVNLLLKGNGKTYSLANLLSTTTGKLTVTNGANAVIKWNAGWAGPVEIDAGSRLIVDSPRAFLGGTSDILIAEGGVLELGASAKVQLKTLTLGSTEVPDGRYTVAGLAACGYGAYVDGSGEIIVSGSGDAGVAKGPNPMDYLVYDLVMTNETPAGVTATANDIFDSCTWSSATPYRPGRITTYDPANDPEGYKKYRAPEPLSVRKVPVRDVYRYGNAVTNEEYVLHFPLNARIVEGEGGILSTGVYSTAIRYESLPPLTGSNVTVRIRYRWDGAFPQGSLIQYDQYFYNIVNTVIDKSILGSGIETAPCDTPQATGYPRNSPINGARTSPGAEFLGSQTQHVRTNRWQDIVYVYTGQPDGTTRLQAYLLDVPENPPSGGYEYYTTSFICLCNKTLNAGFDFLSAMGKFSIGNISYYFDEYGPTGAQKWEKPKSGRMLMGFTGDISKFQIFDKALTLEEINAVFGGGSGGLTFKAGRKNGSGDEFGAADDPEIAAAFDPRTMPASRMRKVLDAAHPSLTLKVSLKSEEASLARVLRIAVLRDDLLGDVPLEVRANGYLVDTLDFSRETEKGVFLRPRHTARDADGYMTIVLTRPGSPVGTLFIDSLELSGSWAAGTANTDWCFSEHRLLQSNACLPNWRSVIGGAWDQKFLLNMIYGINKKGNNIWYPVEKIVFALPKEVLDAQCESTFNFVPSSIGPNGEIDVYVNDRPEPFAHFGPGLSSGTACSMSLPIDVLREGYNTFCVSNSSSQFSPTAQDSDYNSINFKSFKYTIKPPSSGNGLLMIVR